VTRKTTHWHVWHQSPMCDTLGNLTWARYPLLKGSHVWHHAFTFSHMCNTLGNLAWARCPLIQGIYMCNTNHLHFLFLFALSSSKRDVCCTHNEPYGTQEWVMSHIRMHREWVMSHIRMHREWVMSHIRMHREWVMSHIRMHREWVMSHIRIHRESRG